MVGESVGVEGLMILTATLPVAIFFWHDDVFLVHFFLILM